MDSNQDTSTTKGNAKVIEIEGLFGVVVWRISNELYNRLPRAQRDQLLKNAADNAISQSFRQLTCNILAFVDREDLLDAGLDTSWAQETIEVDCGMGQTIDVDCDMAPITWMIPQGLAEAMGDQRAVVAENVEEIIHQLIHHEAQGLLSYARQQLASGL